jgi:hypothetical protein
MQLQRHALGLEVGRGEGGHVGKGPGNDLLPIRKCVPGQSAQAPAAQLHDQIIAGWLGQGDHGAIGGKQGQDLVQQDGHHL